MKLYSIPRDSKIYLQVVAPGDSQTEQQTNWEMCTFDHLDGMYSHITTPNGAVIHLSASAEVNKVGDHYEIAD